MPADSIRRFALLKKATGARWMLLTLLLVVLPQVSYALQARPISPSVVLVLKLVSNTRAQPATGIVLSKDGLVMVPAEFIVPAGEMIVLDGGTDIIKNGRPAVVVNQSPANGWALISVAGLNRPGITLSENSPTPESELHLSAFPPAEYIASGMPPLWAGVKVKINASDGSYSISDETPQPYVAGPILDDCGYLTGVSLTSGTQDVKADKTPVTRFAGSLKSTLDELQVKLTAAPCASNSEKTLAALVKAEPTVETAIPKDNSNINPRLVRPEVFSPSIQRKRLNPFQGTTPRPGPVEKPSVWSELPLWLILAGLAMLAALVWKAVFFFRLRREHVGTSGLKPSESSPGFRENSETVNQPRSAIREHPGMPDLDALPEGCNGVLVVEIRVDADTRFKRFCVVNTENIDISIGRDIADISIPHPGISDSHARFRSDGLTMNLSDLGSASGTYIKTVPCLKGEIMYFGPEDEVSLGELQLRFSVIHKDMSPS